GLLPACPSTARNRSQAPRMLPTSLPTELRGPFRAFSCRTSRTTAKCLLLARESRSPASLNSDAGGGYSLSRDDNDAGARTFASTVIAVAHSRIKVHGVP